MFFFLGGGVSKVCLLWFSGAWCVLDRGIGLEGEVWKGVWGLLGG
jgi:hypothetical protein